MCAWIQITLVFKVVEQPVVTLDQLSPHQLVSVEMTANTSVGEGPRSTTENGTTDPAGIKLEAMTYEFSVWINAFSLLNVHCLLLEEMCARK